MPVALKYRTFWPRFWAAFIDAGIKVTLTSQHPIDAYHYDFMRRHTEKGVPLELLIDLQA
ncbi:MAG: hypothetical protein IPM35_15075 [Myxococcales bacterium]|nr:hypothetical protein [Myxococcales bacterium]